MVVLRRLIVLFAVASGIGAVLARFDLFSLRGVSMPSAWLRVTDTLLLLAIALMLEQIVAQTQAKKTLQPGPAVQESLDGP